MTQSRPQVPIKGLGCLLQPSACGFFEHAGVTVYIQHAVPRILSRYIVGSETFDGYFCCFTDAERNGLFERALACMCQSAAIKGATHIVSLQTEVDPYAEDGISGKKGISFRLKGIAEYMIPQA